MNFNQKEWDDDDFFETLKQKYPFAVAKITGSAEYPEIEGEVWFYQTDDGVLVAADIENLPKQNVCGGVFGFHIHEGNCCCGNEQDSFADTKGHYNPNGCPHPYHAGDLPPLFANDGEAWMAVLTNRFTLNEILSRTVVVHDKPDDFTTQPSGNSGRKIACGIIQ